MGFLGHFIAYPKKLKNAKKCWNICFREKKQCQVLILHLQKWWNWHFNHLSTSKITHKSFKNKKNLSGWRATPSGGPNFERLYLKNYWCELKKNFFQSVQFLKTTTYVAITEFRDIVVALICCITMECLLSINFPQMLIVTQPRFLIPSFKEKLNFVSSTICRTTSPHIAT